ncbi:MAG: PDZ domain-containing protein [Helicobacteraceae bacterium]|jgi:type II secretion system protein C|nr:PDZ domain-containing protein [Helicobacteraceae bacterium]
MNINFNPSLVRFIRNTLMILLVAKALSLVMLWFFQSEGVNYHPNNSKMPEYKRYSVHNIINPTQKPDIQSAEPATDEENALTAYGPNISNMILKGLFKRKNGGFVIIALKAQPNDSEVIGIDDVFKGYALKKVLENGAIFSKDGQTFSLYFSEEDQQEYAAPTSNMGQSDDGGIKQVAKSDITHYAKNVNQIWKDISIVEVKENGKITGFKVTRITAGTPFAQLGLRQGDIIIRANNKPMTSYKDAIAIYKGIDKLDALQLIVLRNNQETEIVYEIF